LRVPFAIADATTITEAATSAAESSTFLRPAFDTNADHDVEPRAARDSITSTRSKDHRKSDNRASRASSGEGVPPASPDEDHRRHDRERFREGVDRKHPQPDFAGSTREHLFICGGAFVGLEKIVQGRTDLAATLGSAPTSRDKRDYKLG